MEKNTTQNRQKKQNGSNRFAKSHQKTNGKGGFRKESRPQSKTGYGKTSTRSESGKGTDRPDRAKSAQRAQHGKTAGRPVAAKTDQKKPAASAANPAVRAKGDATMRLQKFLAERGVASRRAAEELIAAGRVKVNGTVVTAMGAQIDPKKDKVTVDGAKVDALPRLRYILLYKPAGYICSAHDERGRRTVLDLVGDVEQRIYPVGRLDYDTSGLLLLTNDGELTNHLLHPSQEVQKTYLAQVEGCPDQAALDKLRRGVRLKDGMTAPAAARILRRKEEGALVELTIHEGRNRQVRRMLEAVGYPVLHLRRSALAFLTLEGLNPGEWRELDANEVSRLRSL